jgi:hypothetical protein
VIGVYANHHQSPREITNIKKCSGELFNRMHDDDSSNEKQPNTENALTELVYECSVL